MQPRVLTFILLAGVALPDFALAQASAPSQQPSNARTARPATQPAAPVASAPQSRARDNRSQAGLTAAPTDFGRVDIRDGGDSATPGGVTGKDLGGGYMIEEEATKTRSTVTRDAIDKLSPTANPYQMIQLLPGANVSSVDAFGLVGGNITMRGFNSDQIGLTIEGAPVNDSGNYALFPQEYVDSENIGQVSTAQGSPDLDSPHIGATGGVINIYMREPSKTKGGMAGFSYGSNSTMRGFLRGETGQIGDFRAFASMSRYTGHHWNDPGVNNRSHFDFKGVYEPGNGNRVALSVIYNEAVNNSYFNPTQAQYNSGNAGWLTTLPSSFFTGPDQSANSAFNWFGFRVNPFKNAIVSLPSSFAVAKDVTWDSIPYFWYGFGNGGGTATMSEQPAGSASNGVFFGSKSVGGTNLTGVDWTGNGIVTATNKALYYNPSITLTHRPGIINKLTYSIGDHKLVAGYWFELARHQQTAPYASLTAGGSISDPYLSSGSYYITSGPFSGQQLNRRNTVTQTMTNMLFVGDTWSPFGDKLAIEYGVKQVWINRRVSNFLPGATPLNTFDDQATLPQVGFRYKIDEMNQVFGSLGTSFRSTPNFTLTEAYSNSTGALTTPIKPLPAEQSMTLELGHRYQGEMFSTSLSVFGTHYRNRQISSNIQDPSGGTGTINVAINAGSVDIWGVDGEIGTRRLWGGWRGYVSGELLHTKLLDNMAAGTTTGAVDYLQTAGKQLPRAPNYQMGLGVDYDDGHLFGNISYKYIGRQFSTLMNDETMSAYGRLDSGIGYRFDSVGGLIKPEFKLNFYNLQNARSLIGVNGVQPNAQQQIGLLGGVIRASSAPTYYLGQGFAVMASFKTGF